MSKMDSLKTREEKLAAVFLDKPEMVLDLPEWMLPEKQLNAYRQMHDLAIVEIAGRDSVAAAIQAVAINGYGNLLPVYAYTGTECGSWAHVEKAVSRLTKRLPQVTVHPLLVVGSPGFWHAINGRFISELFDVFGHYSPCTGCHLYLHSVRVPLARMLNNTPIIGGERRSHSGRIKVNQIDEAIECYKEVVESFGIHLDEPLVEIEDNNMVEKILQMPWGEDKNQLGCTLSSNYRTSDGKILIKTKDLIRFFNEFAAPVARSVISEYLSGSVPDHEEIAKKVLAR